MKLRSLTLLLLVAPLLAGAAPQGKTEGPRKGSSVVAKEAGLDGLRKRCYGGRNAGGAGLLMDHLDRSLLRALASEDYERVTRITRRLLQAGGDEAYLIPPFLLAAEATEESLSDSAREACQALFNKVAKNDER